MTARLPGGKTHDLDGTGLEIEQLVVQYGLSSGAVLAVRGVSLRVQQGSRMGLVGESGSGKSTLASALLGVLQPPGEVVSGSAKLNGDELLSLSGEELRRARFARVSMVPQAAMNSLNPTLRIGDHLQELMDVHRDRAPDKIISSRRPTRRRPVPELLDMVGLDPSVAKRYPHELSGGMKQRVNIALAVSLNPELIIADEPTSALDVVVQRSIMRTLITVQSELNASLLLIGHDMALMAHAVNAVAVMYGGQLVEIGETHDVIDSPAHPYTKLLIESVPDRRRLRSFTKMPGQPPSLAALPPGCAFHPRCPKRFDRCPVDVPSMHRVTEGHLAACHLYGE